MEFIASIDADTTGIPGAVDFDGDFLLPGLAESHTDNSERHLMPRPQVRWPGMPALFAHDATMAAACGPRFGMSIVMGAPNVVRTVWRAGHRIN